MARRVVQSGRFRRRLTIAFVLVAAVSSGALALGAFGLVRNARLDDSLARAAADARFRLVVAQDFLPLDDDRSRQLLTSLERAGLHAVLVADAHPTPSNPDVDPALPQRLRSVVAAGQIGYERLVTAGRPVLLIGGRIPGSTAELYLITSEDRLDHDLDQLATVLAAGWLAVVVAAALIGTMLARRTLEPVGRASEAARAVAEGLLATRLPVEGRDEFGVWAASFNQMAEALQVKIDALAAAGERERRFTADVAHELRTPVTSLVAAASLLREHLDRLPAETRRPAELLVGDTMRLRHLVEELMEISRLDAGAAPAPAEEVDLTVLLGGMLRAHGWNDRVNVDGEAVLATDPRRLERIVANLVGNGVEHGTPPVRVDIATDPHAVRVRVRDNGPGIPDAHLPHLFERFYKADPSRTGTGSGLGLAIASENARLLGGRITASNAPGGGAEFEFTLPVARLLHDGEAVDDLAADGVKTAPTRSARGRSR